MKNILAMDTSSRVLSLALKIGGHNTSEIKLVGFLKHAENLLPMIDKMLRKQNISLKEIDAFLIGLGPGSFTGLRIGFATLKGFLALGKRPCFGAMDLDMIAHPIELPEGSELLVVLDARRDKLYARFYFRRKDQWQTRGKVQVISVNECLRTLRNSKEIYLAGDALERYGEVFKAKAGSQIHFLPENTWFPRASTLIRFFEEKKQRLKPLTAAKDFIPLYFRFSEAEEKRKMHAISR